MPRGTVRCFDEKKGYGFIEEDGGGEVFLHGGAILLHDMRTLQQGRRVVFDIRRGGRDPVAENVRPL